MNIANPFNENFLKKVCEISIIAGRVLFTVPFTRERVKKKFLTDALRKYR
jgi:hypothetical protein